MARPRKIIEDSKILNDGAIDSSESVKDQEVTVEDGRISHFVKVHAPVRCNVRRQSGEVVSLIEGINEVPEDVADHWYAAAHGVVRV